MDEATAKVVCGICAAVGALGGALFGMLGTLLVNYMRYKNDKRRVVNDIEESQETAAVNMYHQMVIEMKPQVASLQVELREVRSRELLCREEGARQGQEIRNLRKVVRWLKKALEDSRKEERNEP